MRQGGGGRRAPGGQTVALVRPPRFAGGGGQALPFGSGAPGMPRPGTQRARDLATQMADDARGRFTERIFTFADSGLIAPGATGPVPGNLISVVSNRTSFVRLVAMRGSIVGSSGTLDPFGDPANLRVRIQINGEEDMMTSGGANASFASYADLFTTSAPWFWLAAPPRLRVGDQLQATWTNTHGGGGTSLSGSLCLRLVDDAWWRALYGT